MNNKEVLKAKRAKVLRELGKTPEGKALLAAREAKAQGGKDVYLEAVKQVNWLIGKLGVHFEDLESKSNAKLAEISGHFAQEVTKIEKVLKSIADVNESAAMLEELRDTKNVLKDLASRKQPAPIVNVPAPVVHVKAPEATVIDKTETKFIAETKYQEKTVEALTQLKAVLEEVAKNTNAIAVTRIKSSMKDPVYVQLVDKKGRSVMDFSDMMQATSGSSSASGGGVTYVAQDPTDMPTPVAVGEDVDPAADQQGRTIIYDGMHRFGDDEDLDLVKVEQRFTATRVTADGQIKSTAGFVHAITITPTTATPTAGLVTVYANSAESGTVIYSEWVFATTPGHTIMINAVAGSGIYVGYDATLANVSVTVIWR